MNSVVEEMMPINTHNLRRNLLEAKPGRLGGSLGLKKMQYDLGRRINKKIFSRRKRESERSICKAWK